MTRRPIRGLMVIALSSAALAGAGAQDPRIGNRLDAPSRVAITALLDKRIDGFGELFRSLSYAEIGAAAMLSRACAGTIGRTAIFALPGSPAAVISATVGHVRRCTEPSRHQDQTSSVT